MKGRSTRRIRARRTALAAALAIAAALLGVSAPPAQASLADLPYRLVPAMTSSVGVDPGHLADSGPLVVWQDSRAGQPDIFGYDLDDNREFRVARTPGYRVEPAISGSIVVWASGSDPARRAIEGVDLGTGSTFTVTDQPGEVASPAISERTVVWRERRDGRWQIRGKNLVTGRSFAVPVHPGNQAHPAISGSTVVWQDFRNGNWDIYRYDIGANREEAVVATSADETAPVLSGSTLVFLRRPATGGPPALVAYDLARRAEREIVTDHLVMRAAAAGGIVVWEDWRTGLPDIYGYDVDRGQVFAVARSQRAYAPAVSSQIVAWISRSSLGQGRVQGLRIVPRLPTDPRDRPAVPSPNSLYVSETKHTMSAGFKSFWQSHGGLEIFGYPLTEEFTEKDPATGDDVVVQYFQRVKLEYRASAPANQRITLARLGAELTEGREFPRVPPFQSTGDRVYFKETGHSLAYGFKAYWEAHGGLAMFGYPISKEFTENGRTVQYFERARFEFNPDARDANSRVTLGLLGQEALQRRGWLPMPPVDTTQLAE